MDRPAGKTRTDEELLALAGALSVSSGAAPGWLTAELSRPFALGAPAAPEPGAYRGHMRFALSLAGVLAAFIAGVDLVAEVKVAPNRVPPPVPVAVDEDAQEAVALVRSWRLAGDDLAVSERLHEKPRRPGEYRAWSAERSEEGVYLVVYREPTGSPAYAFEADLESGLVAPTPEAVDGLTALRLRDEAPAATYLLVASAH